MQETSTGTKLSLISYFLNVHCRDSLNALFIVEGVLAFAKVSSLDDDVYFNLGRHRRHWCLQLWYDKQKHLIVRVYKSLDLILISNASLVLVTYMLWNIYSVFNSFFFNKLNNLKSLIIEKRLATNILLSHIANHGQMCSVIWCQLYLVTRPIFSIFSLD